MQVRYKLNLKTILAFSIGPVGVGALGLITMPIIAWKFSADDVALYSLLQVGISLSFILLGLGSEQAFVRDYNETSSKSQLLLETNVVSYLLMFLLIGLLILFNVNFSDYVLGYKNTYIDIYIYIVLVANYFLVKSLYILRMKSKGVVYSALQLTPKLLLLVGVIFFVKSSVIFVENYLFFIQTFVIIATALIALYFTKGEWNRASRSKLKRDSLIKVMRYSLPLFFSSVGFWGLSSLDRFMLLDMATTKDVALYSLAMNFCAIGLMLNMIFATVWTPIVYQWIADKADLKKIYAITKMVSVVVIILFCVTGMFSWAVPHILPSKYREVEAILTCGMFFSLLYGLSETTVVGLNIQRKTNYILIATLIAFVTNFLLNFLLIPSYGYVGAAISTAISMYVFFICRTEFSCYFWMGFKRKALYIEISIILFLSITQALCPQMINYSLVWLVLSILVIYGYKNEFKNIYYLVKHGVVQC